MCFIADGCCRLYRYDKNGTDHTVRFGVGHWWMTDPESYNQGTPSLYNIEALSASTVIIWNKDDWEKVMHEIPAFKRFYQLEEKLSDCVAIYAARNVGGHTRSSYIRKER